MSDTPVQQQPAGSLPATPPEVKAGYSALRSAILRRDDPASPPPAPPQAAPVITPPRDDSGRFTAPATATPATPAAPAAPAPAAPPPVVTPSGFDAIPLEQISAAAAPPPPAPIAAPAFAPPAPVQAISTSEMELRTEVERLRGLESARARANELASARQARALAAQEYGTTSLQFIEANEAVAAIGAKHFQEDLAAMKHDAKPAAQQPAPTQQQPAAPQMPAEDHALYESMRMQSPAAADQFLRDPAFAQHVRNVDRDAKNFRSQWQLSDGDVAELQAVVRDEVVKLPGYQDPRNYLLQWTKGIELIKRKRMGISTVPGQERAGASAAQAPAPYTMDADEEAVWQKYSRFAKTKGGAQMTREDYIKGRKAIKEAGR